MAPRKAAAPVPPEQVAAACLHLLRLAAAHALHGVTFVAVDADGLHEQAPDRKSLDAMAKATEILLADRGRLREKAARALVGRMHEALVPLFEAARDNPEAMENLEDTSEKRLRELGYTITLEDLKAFRVDLQFFHEQKGASQAAAEVIGRLTLGISKRRVYGAEEDAKVRPVPGPLNRHVPFHAIRSYFEHVLATAEAQRLPGAVLQLEALRSDAYAEALQSRVETSFRERMRTELERAEEEMTGFFLALFRGENPVPGYAATPEEEQQLARALAEFRALGAELMSAGGHDPEVVVQKAREGARWWIGDFKMRLGIA